MRSRGRERERYASLSSQRNESVLCTSSTPAVPVLISTPAIATFLFQHASDLLRRLVTEQLANFFFV